MKNKELKKEVITNGTFQWYAGIRRTAAMTDNLDNFLDPFLIDEDTGEVTNWDLYDKVNECERIRDSRKKQRQKVEKHLIYLLKRPDLKCFFLSLTFNNDALQLKPDSRKQAIRRLLQKFSDYVLNIDYGSENEREHYHAVVALPDDYEVYEIETTKGTKQCRCDILDEYKYGFYNMEPIRCDSDSPKLLANYMNKLTSHSIKVKQSYISVKKGSDYQTHEDLMKERKRVAGLFGLPGRQERIDALTDQIRESEQGEYSQMTDLFGNTWTYRKED